MQAAGVEKYEVSGFLGMTLETLESAYGQHAPALRRGSATRFHPAGPAASGGLFANRCRNHFR
jgi:hypothetical protein